MNIWLFILGLLCGIIISLCISIKDVEPTIDNYKYTTFVDDLGVCYRYNMIYIN